jgi:hypothetical protein
LQEISYLQEISRKGSVRVLFGGAALAAGAARSAGGERFLHDAPDGARAPPALCAAAEAAIDLTRRARRLGMVERRAHVVIGQHVTGTDDHESSKAPTRIGSICNYRYFTLRGQAKRKRLIYTYSNVWRWTAWRYRRRRFSIELAMR